MLTIVAAFPNNRDELISSFNKIRDREKEGTKYFLQFVGHGCGGEIVAWKDLAEHLEEVNTLSNNTLLLKMSTCKCINAVKVTASDGDYPFFGIIGAT